MKFKLLLIPVIFFIILVPFIINAESCDLDKISIESVILKNKSDQVVEVEPPIIDGKSIKINLKMINVGDTMEYSLVLKNDSFEDYEIDENSFQSNSGYIEYSLDSKNGSTIIKAGEEKEVCLKVQYKTAVPDSAFNGATYNDNENIALNLSHQQALDNIKNPQTSYHFFLLILAIILCLGTIIFLMFYKKKNHKVIILILGIFGIIPISVLAICKVQFNIESSVSIEKGFRVDYLVREPALYTDSELTLYEKTSDTECRDLYVGDEKYNVCDSIIIKDNMLHREGESVPLNVIKLKGLDLELDNGCDERDDGSFICSPDLIMDLDFSKWYYYKKYINDNGYVFDQNDRQIMFSEYDDSSFVDESFFANAPQTFTMPSHHVLFSSSRGR